MKWGVRVLPALSRGNGVLTPSLRAEFTTVELNYGTGKVFEAVLARVESPTPEQWKHYGMHSYREQGSIEHIVRMFSGHDINHPQQIERILTTSTRVWDWDTASGPVRLTQ